MDKPLYGIYGAGGCGRGILPLARVLLNKANISLSQLVFIDDLSNIDNKNGHSVISYKDFTGREASQKYVAVAISNSIIREELANKINNDGFNLWSIQADNVVVMDDVVISEGALLSPFVCLTSNIIIGCCFHANLYSYVEHDCIIGNYVTFAPGVKCNGNVVIEDHAYIGAGAIIKQGTPERPLIIGERAVIGMGAIVTKNVSAGDTVIGNPAKPM